MVPIHWRTNATTGNAAFSLWNTSRSGRAFFSEHNCTLLDSVTDGFQSLLRVRIHLAPPASWTVGRFSRLGSAKIRYGRGRIEIKISRLSSSSVPTTLDAPGRWRAWSSTISNKNHRGLPSDNTPRVVTNRFARFINARLLRADSAKG